MIKARHIGQLVALFFIGMFSWKIYTYFFDHSLPSLTTKGLNTNKYYSGKSTYTFCSDKKSYITLWCDEKMILKNQYIPAGENGYAYDFDTTQFSNGTHTIRVECTDTRFAKNKTVLDYVISIDNTPLKIDFINDAASLKIAQGKTLHISFEVNKPLSKSTIEAFSQLYTPVKESKNSSVYECFIPIDCQEQANTYTLQLSCTDAVGNTVKQEKEFEVIAFPFKKEVLAINQSKIEEEKEIGKHPDEFAQKMITLTKNSPREKLWKGSFCTPIDIQRITCEFGTIRTTQHKGRYMHKALDVINAPKSVVWATQNGIIAIKDRFADTGNTVVIDHGCGIMSLFFHLDDFAEIEIGQKITQGNPIGKIGKTGYATGYHLHWEMRVNNIAVDPLQWTTTII